MPSGPATTKPRASGTGRRRPPGVPMGHRRTPWGPLNGSRGFGVAKGARAPRRHPRRTWITDCLDTYRSAGDRTRRTSRFEPFAVKFGLRGRACRSRCDIPPEDEIFNESAESLARLERELRTATAQLMLDARQRRVAYVAKLVGRSEPEGARAGTKLWNAIEVSVGGTPLRGAPGPSRAGARNEGIPREVGSGQARPLNQEGAGEASPGGHPPAG